MASNSEEKRGLTQSFRSQMGYGTAPVTAASRKMAPRTQKFINRKLSRTDTLQGVALRYGVTVQDLKRENRLYTNDSIFLRETLLIPVTHENEDCMDPDDEIVVVDGPSGKLLEPQGKSAIRTGDSGPLRNGGALGSAAVLQVHNEITGDMVEDSRRSTSDPLAMNHGINDRSRHNPSSDSSRPVSSSCSLPSSKASISSSSAKDFFSKYDQNIAYLKEEVARMENNTTNLDGLVEANPLALPSRKGSHSSSSSGWASFHVSDDETDGAPILLIRSRTNNRQIKSTLERSQQASDELFEL